MAIQESRTEDGRVYLDDGTDVPSGCWDRAAVAAAEAKIKALEAEVALLRAQVPAWRPIADVPTDGTKVLCWRDGDIRTAWYYEDDIFKRPALGGRGWSYPPYALPTHWRPLPEGPTAG